MGEEVTSNCGAVVLLGVDYCWGCLGRRGGVRQGVDTGSDIRSVESSLALAPLIDSVRSELARCQSCMIKVLPVVGARSSRTTQRGGENSGADGRRVMIPESPGRSGMHSGHRWSVWIVGRNVGIG